VPCAGLVTSVIRDLDEAGVAVNDISLQLPTLEDAFRGLTGSAAAGLPSGDDAVSPEAAEARARAA
jgi:hypothetical protein